MIWYFQEGFWLSIRVEIEQRGQELDSFEELIKKVVNVEAKAAFRPHSYAHKTDQHCLRGSRLSAAKASTQNQPMKDPRVEKPGSGPRKSKTLAFQRFDNAETSKKAWKEKKKKKND